MAEQRSTSTQGNGSPREGGLTDAAGQASKGLMDQVKHRTSAQVTAQQSKAADGLGSVAKALRKAGHELRPHSEGLASYADMAVDELEHLSTRLREKTPGEYVSDLEDFARHRPVAFLGGTFLLGLGLARFLKSSRPRRGVGYGRSAGAAGGRRGGEGLHSGDGRDYTGQRSAVGSSAGMGTPAASGAAPVGTYGDGQPSAGSINTPSQRSHLSSPTPSVAHESPSSPRDRKPATGRGRETGGTS
jgi:hypothetical protein